MPLTSKTGFKFWISNNKIKIIFFIYKERFIAKGERDKEK